VPLSFNTAGPCIPGEHYMLPPERRLGPVLQLIEERKYFTLHAGRQTGKTTSLMWLERHLNDSGRWRAVWVDLETAREQPDPAAALATVLETIDDALRLRHAELDRPDATELETALRNPAKALLDYLRRLSAFDERPLVLLLDEADGLVGPAMVSFLTQLRHAYIERSQTPYPSSVVLVGQRQVRDYVLGTLDRKAVSWLGTTSPFNITAEATTLGPFTAAEVEELLGQHTTATGQRFEPEAMRRILIDYARARVADKRGGQQQRVGLSAVDAAGPAASSEQLLDLDTLLSALATTDPRAARVVGLRFFGGLREEDVAEVLQVSVITVKRDWKVARAWLAAHLE
jgi:hypothetical protein